MRIRQVWPREQVAHLWANASQDSARDPSGNMYFTGPALYSYGGHFCIGYRLERADGSPLFLLNADRYSATTSKMQRIARRAIHGDIVHMSGLRADSFTGQAWRRKLAIAALAQAGALYSQAGAVKRVSRKRYALMSEAAERVTAARALADIIRADRSASADDLRAARAVLSAIDRAAAVTSATGDNAGERKKCDARALILAREDIRATYRAAVERAARYMEVAECDMYTWTRRHDAARDAVNTLNNARDMAKRYGFRVPSLRAAQSAMDAAAPHAHAERVADLAKQARQALERAERHARDRRSGDAEPWKLSAIIRETGTVAAAAKVASLSVNGRLGIAEWMVERAAVLARRAGRAERLAAVPAVLAFMRGCMKTADSYADAGHARDAGRTYREAMGHYDKAAAILEALPHHPLRRDLAALAGERERAAAYDADLAARVAAENAAAVAAWRDGGPRPFAAWDMPPMLRLSSDGKNIETSHGAIVPVSAAPRLWRLVERVRGGDTAAGSAFRGMHVGPFTLSEIRPDGSAVIGCHDIQYSEMAAMAARLNLGIE